MKPSYIGGITLMDIFYDLEKDKIREKDPSQWIYIDELRNRAEQVKYGKIHDYQLVNLKAMGLIEKRGDYYRVKRIRIPLIKDGKWINY